MKTLAIVVVCLFGACFCGMNDLKPYEDTARLIFQTEDLDGDGIMTLAEIQAWFALYDTNGDGRMTRHEYTEGVCSQTPQLYQLGHYLYDRYDVDGDHHVDLHDWENFLGLMDANGDGSVVEEEFVPYWVAMFEHAEHSPDHPHAGDHGQSACH